MSSTIYDSRFFTEHFHNPDEEIKKKEVRKTKRKYVSTVVIHEVYGFP